MTKYTIHPMFGMSLTKTLGYFETIDLVFSSKKWVILIGKWNKPKSKALNIKT